jgi:hypothetical protein
MAELLTCKVGGTWPPLNSGTWNCSMASACNLYSAFSLISLNNEPLGLEPKYDHYEIWNGDTVKPYLQVLHDVLFIILQL